MRRIQNIGLLGLAVALLACDGSGNANLNGPPRSPVDVAPAAPDSAAPLPRAEPGRFAVLVTGIRDDEDRDGDGVGDVAGSIAKGLVELNTQVFGSPPAGAPASAKGLQVLTTSRALWEQKGDLADLARLALAESGASVVLHGEPKLSNSGLCAELDESNRVTDVDVCERPVEREQKGPKPDPVVHLAGAHDDLGTGRLPLDEVLELSPSAAREMALVIYLAALVEASRAEAIRGGSVVLDRLEPVVKKVEAQLGSPRGSAGWILGNAQLEIGLRKGDGAALERAERAFAAAWGSSGPPVRPTPWFSELLASRAFAVSAAGQPGKAMMLYEAALMGLSRRDVPVQWACTQTGLGNALTQMGAAGAGSGHLERAVKLYQESLGEYTREKWPLHWAAAQQNIGTALTFLGAGEAGTARLEEAIEAFRQALSEHTRERVPLTWAAAQRGLGNALATLGARETGTARLEEAVQAYENASLETTRERDPVSWVPLQSNLALGLRILGERKKDSGLRCRSLQAYLQILQVAKAMSASSRVEQSREGARAVVRSLAPDAPTDKPTCTPPIADDLWGLLEPDPAK